MTREPNDPSQQSVPPIDEVSETPVERHASRVPKELKRAIDGIDGENQFAIVVKLIDDGALSFSELKSDLDIHQQSLSNALQSLQKGGIVTRRNNGDLGDRYDSLYTMSIFGERFIDQLFESLGKPKSGIRSFNEFVSEDHINGMLFESYQKVSITGDSKDRVSGFGTTDQVMTYE